MERLLGRHAVILRSTLAEVLIDGCSLMHKFISCLSRGSERPLTYVVYLFLPSFLMTRSARKVNDTTLGINWVRTGFGYEIL
jgi:hypothetical protein